ncbi:MAG: hypothetical protein A2Y17_11740 [Clostridiales bacterium GWF2_38_85]|nr:MAG: hypothetical protein A2Y17_11740 [Clostridiales bacterium GWF2_38_85]HBL85374.1 peptidase U32 [Clostridiales bacterium]
MGNSKIVLPELLSPAGNLEKLRYAVNYGCNAVYVGLKRFGMRAAADNFTTEELREGIEYAHTSGAKLYVTLNVMPRDREFGELRELITQLKELAVDAYIVADIGVMELLKNINPDAVLHLSTQASTINTETCLFWHKYGIKRIVLARELSLEEITYIRKNTPESLELEVFVHGAMCVSYSGRCLLSNYFTGRNANNGQCTQPCRWKYQLVEEKRSEFPIPIEQNDEGTHILSSRDLCMIEHIGVLVKSGVNSLKIEGRVKSAYYTAAVTNAYRMALTDYVNNPDAPVNTAYFKEIASVSHREYDTGYFYTSPLDKAQICTVNEYIKEKAFLSTIEEYNPKTGMALCFQRNKLCLGDTVCLLSPSKTAREIKINELYDNEMNPIENTPHPQMMFYTKIESAKVGDIIRGQ